MGSAAESGTGAAELGSRSWGRGAGVAEVAKWGWAGLGWAGLSAYPVKCEVRP